MAHAQTVRGPIDPSELGFTLPHEHTQIAPVAHRGPLGLLGAHPRRAGDPRGAAPRYREAGGGALVDLTLAGRRARPGVARRTSRAERAPPRDGLRLVSHRLLPAGGAHRPALGRLARRGARPPRRPTGSATPGIRTGIIGEIGTDKPWLSPAEERVHRAAARAARRTGLAITTHAVMSDVGARAADGVRGGGRRSRAGRHRPRRQLPAPRPLPVADRARRVDRVRLPRHVVHARRAATARAGSSTCCSSCSIAATATGSCSARTCATTASCAATRATATRTCSETFLPRLREAGRLRGRDRPADDRQPAAAPHDRLGGHAERGVDLEVHVALQRAGDRAVVLGVLGELLELRLIDARP